MTCSISRSASSSSPAAFGTCTRVNASEIAAMTIDLILGGGVSFILAVYLFIALLRPERF